MLKKILADLPNTPADVAKIWLLPLAKRNGVGWPPTEDNHWRYILRSGRNLEHLRSLRWDLRSVELRPNLLTQDSMEIIIDLFRSHVLNHATMYSAMIDGAQRFTSCCTFLKEHGTFPCPVILEASDIGYHVLDGHHRLCAFFFLYGYFNVEHEDVPCLAVVDKQPAWIASVGWAKAR